MRPELSQLLAAASSRLAAKGEPPIAATRRRVPSAVAEARIRAAPGTLGRRLAELRHAKGLSLRETVERVTERLRRAGDRRPLTSSHLCKLENNKERASDRLLIILASELGADADELFALAGKAPPEIVAMFVRSKGARRFYRAAVQRTLTEVDWRRLLAVLERMGR